MSIKSNQTNTEEIIKREPKLINNHFELGVTSKPSFWSIRSGCGLADRKRDFVIFLLFFGLFSTLTILFGKGETNSILLQIKHFLNSSHF